MIDDFNSEAKALRRIVGKLLIRCDRAKKKLGRVCDNQNCHGSPLAFDARSVVEGCEAGLRSVLNAVAQTEYLGKKLKQLGETRKDLAAVAQSHLAICDCSRTEESFCPNCHRAANLVETRISLGGVA
jgi:hypothetical protein